MSTFKSLWIFILFFMIAFQVACTEQQREKQTEKASDPVVKSGLHAEIVGEWLRPDGNYVLILEKFSPDSTVVARYLNPRPIHISETRWKTQDGYIYFYIKFDDEGYPGSYYSLGYLPEEDKLYGIYYQVMMRQQYEVEFVRN